MVPNHSRTTVADPAAAIEAIPDGMFLADWLEAKRIGRTAGFALLKIVRAQGLEPEKQRQGSAAKASPFLSGQVLEAMNALASEHQGGRSIASLEAQFVKAIVTAPAATEDGGDSLDTSSLLKRLQAAELAITTGLPLTKPEIQWIIGTGIGTETAATARCSVQKRGRRWTLRAPAD